MRFSPESEAVCAWGDSRAFPARGRVEFAEAVQFYERAKDGLGAAFTLEVERTVERICSFPESGTKFSASSRGGITANFPFWVIYRAEGAEVTIIAIAHQRRKPGYWRKRKDAPS